MAKWDSTQSDVTFSYDETISWLVFFRSKTSAGDWYFKNTDLFEWNMLGKFLIFHWYDQVWSKPEKSAYEFWFDQCIFRLSMN